MTLRFSVNTRGRSTLVRRVSRGKYSSYSRLYPEVRYGLTAMCIGIGMGGSVIWENPHHADYVASATKEA